MTGLGFTGRQRVAVALVMSVVAATFLAVPTPAAAGPDKEIVTVDEGSIPDIELMRAQQPLVDAAEAITALDPKREGLGGIRLQVEKNMVEVYWKGEVPDPVREEIANQERNGVTIALGPADYSEAELAAAESGIVDAPDRYPGLAVLAPQPDGGGLQGYFSDPKAAASYEFPVPVAIELAPEGTGPMSRTSDTMPWWGGAVTRVNGASCTTGFAVIQGATRGLLSAAHCDPAGGGLFTTGVGVPIGPSRPPVSISDSIFIPGRSSGRIYWGPPSSSASLGIIGPTPNFPGQWVCTSGAATGSNCSIVNVFVGGVSVIGGVVNFGVTLGVRIWGGIAVGSGDSGGPVVVPLSPFHALAAGLISFAVGGSRCPSGLGICSAMLGYIDINWVLATQAMVLAP